MSTQGNPAVRARMEIPWFKSGAGRPSIWSAADMNVLVAALRALINPSIVRGEVDQVLLSDGNVQFVISKNAMGSGTVSGPYRVKDVFDDYLVCVTVTWAFDDVTGEWVDTEGDTDIFIAKEWKCRCSLSSERILGTDYTYIYGNGPYETWGVGSGAEFNKRRQVQADSATVEIQAIAPPWTEDEEIYAVEVDTGVTYGAAENGGPLPGFEGAPVTLLMVGRFAAWSRVWGT